MHFGEKMFLKFSYNIHHVSEEDSVSDSSFCSPEEFSSGESDSSAEMSSAKIMGTPDPYPGGTNSPWLWKLTGLGAGSLVLWGN